ncbi:MAG: endonuclease/exonuclease/phosphatase family protein [Psychroflexus halocasei]
MSKLKLFTIVTCLSLTFSFAQKKDYKVTTVAFYNVENLFDTINDPKKNDEASPIMEMRESIRGDVYIKKQKNLANVIKRIGAELSQNAPAIVGLAEIENFDVLQDLVNEPKLKKYNYGIVHYDSPDERGIDVALLYQKGIFKPTHSSVKELIMYRNGSSTKRDYTRDQLYVKGLLDGDEIHFMVNHWPSRGSEEANRIKAAKSSRSVVDSVMSNEPNAKIMIMGDFNDGPYNKSITDYLNAKGKKRQVKSNELYNPFDQLFKRGIGTIAWRDTWDLFDQIMVSKSLISKDYSSYQMYKAGIYNANFLQKSEGRKKGYPFRSFDDGGFIGGYSDHFPVYIHLIKEVD